jgi:hypothetical protein
MFRIDKIRHSFLRDEKGTVMAEAVLVLPFMLWAYLALFVYWDAYRSINTVQKAAYTVSDMLSREMKEVTPVYVDGMDMMLEQMIDVDQNAKLRVTSLTWSDTNTRYEVIWSQSPNSEMVPLTTASIAALESRLPEMAGGDSMVLVEVEVDYHPAFNVGINDQTLSQFIATRPRFPPGPRCMTGLPCPTL